MSAYLPGAARCEEPSRGAGALPGAPYGRVAVPLRDLGWLGVLPVPLGQKSPPPEGFTGRDGRDPSDDDIVIWVRNRPCANVAIRYPDGVVGLDVDDYGGKPAARTLTEHEDRLGTRPSTWTVTSRHDGLSGTRLYQVEPGRQWLGEHQGGGVDVIQRWHRYSVVPPSLHPEGRFYRLLDPDGREAQECPGRRTFRACRWRGRRPSGGGRARAGSPGLVRPSRGASPRRSGPWICA